MTKEKVSEVKEDKRTDSEREADENAATNATRNPGSAVPAKDEPVEVLHDPKDPVVEVGVDSRVNPEDDKEAYRASLEAAARARATKEPKLTQEPVVFSWQEQADPEHQKRLARESLKQQRALDKERNAQNKAYLEGRS